MIHTKNKRTTEKELATIFPKILDHFDRPMTHKEIYNFLLVQSKYFIPKVDDLKTVSLDGQPRETNLRSALNNLVSHNSKLLKDLGIKKISKGWTTRDMRARIHAKEEELLDFDAASPAIICNNINPYHHVVKNPKNYKIKLGAARPVRQYQPEFKNQVADNANNMCQITGALGEYGTCEAAHIIPDSVLTENLKVGDATPTECSDSNNGIFLRRDIHSAYDNYHFTINPSSYEIVVSEYLHDPIICRDLTEKVLSIPCNPHGTDYLKTHFKKFNETEKLRANATAE